jgi:type IV secretion system protein VirD4
MAFAVARLPQLGDRLLAADDRGSLPMPVQIAFSQFMQAAGAQKTASGIIATTSDVLTRFMSSRILPSLLGNTNVSLQLGQREMIVFQSDIVRQDAINPIALR